MKHQDIWHTPILFVWSDKLNVWTLFGKEIVMRKEVCINDTSMGEEGCRPMWSGTVELAFQCVKGSKIGPHDHRMSLDVLICHIWYSALK